MSFMRQAVSLYPPRYLLRIMRGIQEYRPLWKGTLMLWIAQSKEFGHIVAIFRSEDEIHELYNDNEHVNIYWVESDL